MITRLATFWAGLPAAEAAERASAHTTVHRCFDKLLIGIAAEEGGPEGISNVQQNTQRWAFLAEASAILSSSLDYETTLLNVAELAVPAIADWCAVDLVHDDGSIRTLAVAHSNPEKLEMAKEFRRRYPIDPHSLHGVANVLRTGKPELYPTISPEALEVAARSEEHLCFMKELGMRSVMLVPLAVSGRIFGSITLISAESGRTFTEEDLNIAASLGIRAALSVENARLFREVQSQRESLLSEAAERERTRRQMEAVVVNMSEGLVIFSPSGDVTYMNPAALRSHGFKSLEEVRLHITRYPELFEIQDLSGKVLAVNDWPGPRMLRGEEVREFECRVHRHDVGHTFYASYSGALVEDTDGNILLGVLTLRDVTRQTEVERALARLSEQRRLALDSAQMGWWHFDLSTGTVHWDERFREIFGVTGEQLDYDAVIALMHPDDRELVRNAVTAATRLEDPRPYSIQYRVMHRDESLHWVQAKGQTYFEGTGDARRAVSFVGTVADITEQKTAENALRESEARFRQLADAMPQIVWQARPDGHVDYYNQQWFTYTGMPPGRTGDQSWEPVLHPDDLARTHQVWTHSIRTGEPYEMEYRFKRASDGEHRWHLGRALPVKDTEGRVLRWFGTNTDIHDYKQLQERNQQLLDSERAARANAERASRMKDEFLATLSHELRTPLNAIMGWATMLREEPSIDDLKEGLEVIERNARAQKRIIEDLLDMSRIISGKVRLDVQKTDLAAAVEAAVDTVRPAADAKGVLIRSILDPLGRPVMGDPARLQQIFWNLLSNAVKFTPNGGRIHVLLERVNSHLEVSVSDTGEGIEPEFLPYVFDRFRQADASSTRKHGGLGLGLAIVKQLVELHGGSVRVKSGGPGKGATFAVALPLTPLHSEDEIEPTRRHPAAEPLFSPELANDLSLQGVKVLVVDDEPDARGLVARLLEARQAEVLTAGSAAEALAAIETHRPHVLVSDIGMPEEDGYSLIRRIRALGPDRGGNVPALALTAYARSEDRVRAVLAGFQMHIAKPVEAAELLTMVASLAGRSGAL